MECRITNSIQLELEFTEKQHNEFDDFNSLICYSEILIRAGDKKEGLRRSVEALDRAIENKELINDAATNYIRNSISTKSVNDVNRAIQSLIASAKLPRNEDSVLEFDWIAAAEKLGADRRLLSEALGLR
jgi:hypothetical protein